MNYKDLLFHLAYAECYGMMSCSFEEVHSAIVSNESINEYLQYFECTMDEYIEDFLNAHQIIKVCDFEAECYSMIRNNHTIWEALREWDLPVTIEEANQYRYEEICKDNYDDTLMSLYFDRY